MFLFYVLIVISIQCNAFKYISLKSKGGIESYTQIYSELRILIHGTKNAFTTLRNNDVVLFELSSPIDDKEKALGLYKTDNTISLLCNEYIGSSEFYVDETQEPLSATVLNKFQRILRIISSDRRGNCYTIEEYIDNDIYIPIKNTLNNVQTNLSLPDQTEKMQAKIELNTDPTLSLSIAEAEVDVAMLKLKLLKLRKDNSEFKLSQIKTDYAPLPVGPYSQAIKANGFIFISGCIGMDPHTNKLVSTTTTTGISSDNDNNNDAVIDQTKQALNNLKSIIVHGGSDVTKICKTTIFVTNLNNYSIINKLYGEFLTECGVTIFPARSTVEVKALPLNAIVEIEAIALQ